MENEHRAWQRVLLIILHYILIVGIFQFLGALIAGADLTDINIQKTSEQDVIMSLFSLLGTLLVIWLFMKYLDKEKFIDLGFNTKNRLNEFVIGIAFYYNRKKTNHLQKPS